MNEQQNADVRDQIGTKNGQYPLTKHTFGYDKAVEGKDYSVMRIEVVASLILTVPTPKKDDKPEDVILAVEQFINNLHGFNRAETGTTIGVRIHTHGYKTTK